LTHPAGRKFVHHRPHFARDVRGRDAGSGQD
jgi:hypothetical protein